MSSDKTTTPYLSIIIPAFNEEGRIDFTLRSIYLYCRRWQETTGRSFEIIVVDDGSTDLTESVALRFKMPEVRVLRYSINEGKGFAVKTGMLAAQGRVRLFTDADNSTPISELDKFWPVLDTGAQVVIGSRTLAGSRVVVAQNWFRRQLGRAANRLIQLMLVPGITDTQCGFKAFTAGAAQVLFTKQTLKGWGFDFEILAMARRLKMPLAQVPVSWYNSEQSRVQPVISIVKTLAELARIRLNFWQGRYGAAAKPRG